MLVTQDFKIDYTPRTIQYHALTIHGRLSLSVGRDNINKTEESVSLTGLVQTKLDKTLAADPPIFFSFLFHFLILAPNRPVSNRMGIFVSKSNLVCNKPTGNGQLYIMTRLLGVGVPYVPVMMSTPTPPSCNCTVKALVFYMVTPVTLLRVHRR